jgi:hypothetical protein
MHTGAGCFERAVKGRAGAWEQTAGAATEAHRRPMEMETLQMEMCYAATVLCCHSVMLQRLKRPGGARPAEGGRGLSLWRRMTAAHGVTWLSRRRAGHNRAGSFLGQVIIDSHYRGHYRQTTDWGGPVPGLASVHRRAGAREARGPGAPGAACRASPPPPPPLATAARPASAACPCEQGDVRGAGSGRRDARSQDSLPPHAGRPRGERRAGYTRSRLRGRVTACQRGSVTGVTHTPACARREAGR